MTTQSPVVSVIIPCYNQGQYLDEAVDSVLSQSYQNFEIIVVNDGSTEIETIEILENYNKPKTLVLHTDNQGVSLARNHAIAIANGKYILPLDADDKIGNTYLEQAVKLLESNENLGIVYCEAQFFGSQSGKWSLPEYQFPDILLENVIFCSAFFRRSDWQKTEGYSSKMIFGFEDYDFWLSIIEIGKDVYRIPQILFFYRRKSVSRSQLIPNSREKFIYSYHQLFSNHPDLYIKNIRSILVEAVDSREQIKNIRSILVEAVDSREQNVKLKCLSQVIQSELERLHQELQNAQSQLQRSQNNILAMESSKFWKLRQIWFKIKNKFRLI